MARREVIQKFCDRCLKDEPATSTQKFSLNAVEYEIDVCEKHADALVRDILGWGRVAREKERPTPFRRPDTIRAITRETRTSFVKSDPTAMSPEMAALPAMCKDWMLTAHAEEQLAERGPRFGFTKADVYLCAVEPERTVDAKGGRRQHVRGNVQLIVSPEEKKVVTVLPRSTREFGRRKELASANSSN